MHEKGNQNRLWFVMSCCILWLVSCVSLPDFPDPQLNITFSEIEDGKWKLDYEFEFPVKNIVFRVNKDGFFRGTWEPDNPAHKISRRGGLDYASFPQPTSRVSYTIDPALAWSTTSGLVHFDFGLVASSDLFKVANVQDLDDLDEANGTLGGLSGVSSETNFHIKTNSSVLHSGNWQTGSDYSFPGSPSSYFFAGTADVINSEYFAAVLDADLPKVFSATFEKDVSGFYEYFSEQVGYEPESRTTILFSYIPQDSPQAQAKAAFISRYFSGQVSENKDMVLVVSDGNRDSASTRLRSDTLRFLGHETAHIFQRISSLHDREVDHRWLLEGSAENMTMDALRVLGLDADNYVRNQYDEAIKECGQAISFQPLEVIRTEVHYDCGFIISTVSAASLPEHTIYDIWNHLTKSLTLQGEENVTPELYFQTLEELGMEVRQLNTIKSLVKETHKDGHAMLLAVLESAGVSIETSLDGSLLSIDLP